jgi:Uma2 family endonuclease
MRGQTEVDLSVDPPPDIVLEMEVSRSAIDKLGLFAGIGISEVWRCDGQQVSIFILHRELDSYRESSHSLALPALSREVLTSFLDQSRTTLSPNWFEAVNNWAQERCTPTS